MITYSDDLLFEFQAASRLRMGLRDFRRKVVPHIPSTLVPMGTAGAQPAFAVQDIEAWARGHAGKPKRGVVYFIEAVGLGRVKIGWTIQLAIRLTALQGACPVDLRVLAAIPGGSQDEAALHRRFAADRIRQNNEWFRLSADVGAYLQTVAEYTHRTILSPDARSEP